MKECDGPVDNHTLLWDSAWRDDDPRYAELLKKLVRIRETMKLENVFRVLAPGTAALEREDTIVRTRR